MLAVEASLEFLIKSNCLYFQPIRLQLRSASGTESCEGCLKTHFKHLPSQLALRLSLVIRHLVGSFKKLLYRQVENHPENLSMIK